MTKALQERILISANITVPTTRFICVRYGNVLASRGSVIPMFHEQITGGGPVTITTPEMTRFLLPLNHAVDTVIAALKNADPGETFVPIVPAARIVDVALALIEEREIELVYTGIRPGEKVHEIMVSDEEAWRTRNKGAYYAIQPLLPELVDQYPKTPVLKRAYSSGDALMTLDETKVLLENYDLLVHQSKVEEGEMLR